MTDDALIAELTNDPAGLGYKDKAGGVFKDTPAIGGLLTQPGPAVPNPVPNTTRPTGFLLTPVATARLIGAAKAEACAAALKQQYPTIGDHLMVEGIDPTRDESKAFLGALQGAGVLTADDTAAIQAACVAPVDPHWSPTVAGPCRLAAIDNGNTFADFVQINRVLGR